MDIWKVLGILPTRDKNAIKAAYHEQLTQVHPEEKPEEFKALRAAYEQALQEAEAASAQVLCNPVSLTAQGPAEGLRGLLTDLSQRMPVRLQSFSTGQNDQFTLTLSIYMLDPVV